MEDPVAIESSTFPLEVFNNATLYVPVNTKAKYRNTTGWKDFISIEEMTDDITGGIVKIVTEDNKPSDKSITEVARYNTNGQQIASPQKGVNIILYSNGSIKKVLIK